MRNLVVSLASTMLLGILLAIAPAQAQSVSIDLGKIDPALAAQILEATKKKTPDAPVVTVTQAKEWADIGENVGKAIASTAKALGAEVNEFVKTPVGKWAFFLVFWYVIGQKIWVIVGGGIIWAVLGYVIWRSFRIFHIPQKVVVGEGEKQKVSLVQYEFGTKDAKTCSAIAHAGVFLILSVIMIIKIL